MLVEGGLGRRIRIIAKNERMDNSQILTRFLDTEYRSIYKLVL